MRCPHCRSGDAKLRTVKTRNFSGTSSSKNCCKSSLGLLISLSIRFFGPNRPGHKTPAFGAAYKVATQISGFANKDSMRSTDLLRSASSRITNQGDRIPHAPCRPFTARRIFRNSLTNRATIHSICCVTVYVIRSALRTMQLKVCSSILGPRNVRA